MGKHENQEGGALTLVEAVETLSNIADMGFDREIGITQNHDMTVRGKKVSYRTVHWLKKEDADVTIEVVRETYRSILAYLKNFYKKEYGYVTDEKTIDRIKTIMVLVGEAANKLDKYTHFFKDKNIGSAMELKEYKQLQEFYHKKINRKIDEGVIGKWILAMTRKSSLLEKPIKVDPKQHLQTKHVFVDLDGVKKDSEYELFFMRKEDGSRFFNPRLIRNIKLVCDFGDYFGSEKTEDPFHDLEIWQDRYVQASSATILRSINPLMQDFYHNIAKIRDNELISNLKMALMALMMSSSSANLAERNPIKSCTAYFTDFQVFLRTAIATRDYQRIIAYPPKDDNTNGVVLEELVRRMCHTFFAELNSLSDLTPAVNALIRKAQNFPGAQRDSTKLKFLWSELQHDYLAMTKMLKLHPNGPLMKVLTFLQEAGLKEFDVLMQHNLPNHWFNLTVGDQHISHERIPCPTRQEFIDKAWVVDEFKEFLREHGSRNKKHLLINLQDRTTWKEHCRSQCLEELQQCTEFKKNLAVVTLATDTDFYHQQASYNAENHADLFIQQLKEQLEDPSGGCYFPPDIHKALFPEVIDQLTAAVHQLFFNGKNVLSREQRLDFIQLFYLMLELKIIEISKADSFSFTCKDAIDVGGAHTALLFILSGLLSKENLSDNEYGFLNLILYGPQLLIRERIMLGDRFQRMIAALKTFEHKRAEMGYQAFSEAFLKAGCPAVRLDEKVA